MYLCGFLCTCCLTVLFYCLFLLEIKPRAHAYQTRFLPLSCIPGPRQQFPAKVFWCFLCIYLCGAWGASRPCGLMTFVNFKHFWSTSFHMLFCVSFSFETLIPYMSYFSRDFSLSLAVFSILFFWYSFYFSIFHVASPLSS